MYLSSFVLGLFWAKANEKGVIVGSIMSVIAVFTAMYLDVAWPWFAPIGTFVFLLFGVLVSRRWGAVTAEQQIFINNQNIFLQSQPQAITGYWCSLWRPSPLVWFSLIGFMLHCRNR